MGLRTKFFKQLRPVQEITLLVFSGTVGVSIGLFAFVRLMNGELFFGLHNALISFTALLLFIRVWVYRETYFSGMFISTVCVLGATTVVYIGGIDHFYWMYPGFIAPFFMAGTRTATILCCVGLVILLPKLWALTDTMLFVRAMIALFVNLIFGVTFLAANNLHRQDLERTARTDSLTGVGNRRALDEALRLLTAQGPAGQIETSILMLDIDHFKHVNDRHGHAEGDRVLVAIAKLIEHTIRPQGVIYRYGGEEFTVIASGSKGCGTDLAEAIRSRIEMAELLSNFKITISIGVAVLQLSDTADSALSRADAALLKAKAQGRNRVMVAEDDSVIAVNIRAV